MDIYASALASLADVFPQDEWPELSRVLRTTFDHRPAQWLLPVHSCEAFGAPAEQAAPVVAALACLQISIILIDDMLDEDERGEHNRVGSPAAANMASAFQAAGLDAITRSALSTESKAAILTVLNAMMLQTALGQYLDVQIPGDEQSYWRIVRAKSSPYFGAAIQAGALCAGAGVEAARQMRVFGDLYGEMVQIHDDLTDTMSIPAGPDWVQMRAPLPILFAQLVKHPQRERFLALRKQVADQERLEEAQEILVSCGAVSYCFHQLFERYHKAETLLEAIPMQYRDGMRELLDRLVQPVLSLFDSMGWDYSGLLSSVD